MYQGALEAGAEVLTGVEVVSVDPENCAVTVANGDVLTADLLIGADGPLGQGRHLLMEQDQFDERMIKSFMMYEYVCCRFSWLRGHVFGKAVLIYSQTDLLCRPNE